MVFVTSVMLLPPSPLWAGLLFALQQFSKLKDNSMLGTHLLVDFLPDILSIRCSLCGPADDLKASSFTERSFH